MAYEFFIDNMLCPVTPSKLQVKIKGQNKTLTLINDGEINILKKPGLTEYNFDLLLPNVEYPFAVYKSGFQNAKYFLDKLQDLKANKKAFQFQVMRTLPNGKPLFNTDTRVSLEDYTIKEDAKDGFDVVVSVNLKEHKHYETNIGNIILEDDTAKVSMQATRETDNSPAPDSNTSYTVVSGDCLWIIAKKFYGDGSKYTVIYDANKDKIKSPNLIYPGQVLIIPAI